MVCDRWPTPNRSSKARQETGGLFRIKRGASIIDVTAINNTGKGWNNSAWLRNYSHEEHENHEPYRQYATFKRKQTFTESICMALLSEDFHDYGRKAFKKRHI